MHSPDQNVERNRQLLLERSIAGLQKYGVTTERADLTLNQWLQHLLEELLDGANYIQAAMANSEPSTVHLGANQATIETGSMLNPAGQEAATLTIANGGTEVRLSFETQTHAQAVLLTMISKGTDLQTSEYVRLIDHQQVTEENEHLRGLTPDLPPYPPEGGGLPRYGLRWNGPGQPLSVPFDDGYWTPWHLAAARIAELEQKGNNLYDQLRQWLATESDVDSLSAMETWRQRVRADDLTCTGDAQ
mgnify:CR=1 FL=1|tara:strand:+ start:1658 stop:2395 length:738 start_codon:yes stop_codon:yes gene_type:complete